MYTDYYGLSYNPFEKINVKTHDCFRSNDFQQAIHGMDHATKRMGIGVFTARPGMGKSFACHCFTQGIKPGQFTLADICLTSVAVRDFYRLLCDALGLEPGGSVPAMYKAIREQVAYLYKEKRQPLVLLVDECQFLAQGVLRDLMLLMNVEFDSVNQFSLLLSGESHFLSVLNRPMNEAFRQRIVAHYDFQGLSGEEVVAYVRHKVSCAGATTAIMEDGAIGTLVAHTEGNPRIIDNVMTDALIIGEQQKKRKIDQDVILAAVENRRL